MSRIAPYKALLYAQWKHQWTELTVFAIVAALMPSMIVWQAIARQSTIWQMLNTSPLIATLGPMLAIASGLLLAVRPYALDARTGHTYALSLPVPRASYTLHRAAAGLTLILVPAAAFLVGSVIAVQAAPSIPLLHAYPVGLTLRFVLAAALAFAIGFGVQYGLGRRAARWIVIVGATVIAFEMFGQLALHVSLTQPLWEFLSGAASPLQVFLSRWSLFDV